MLTTVPHVRCGADANRLAFGAPGPSAALAASGRRATRANVRMRSPTESPPRQRASRLTPQRAASAPARSRRRAGEAELDAADDDIDRDGPPVRFDKYGRPALRGHTLAAQSRLVVEWLTGHGYPEAAAVSGTARSGPLHNLWERTSPARQSARRRAHDNRSGRTRDDAYREAHGECDAERRQRRRTLPHGHRKARDGEAGVKAMLAYEPAAHAAATYVDAGRLGDRECTHCAAMLWPAEAVRVPAGKNREGGTGWRGTLCCGNGAVAVEAVRRSAAVDELWREPQSAKDLVKHGRSCVSAAPPTPATP